MIEIENDQELIPGPSVSGSHGRILATPFGMARIYSLSRGQYLAR